LGLVLPVSNAMPDGTPATNTIWLAMMSYQVGDVLARSAFARAGYLHRAAMLYEDDPAPL